MQDSQAIGCLKKAATKGPPASRTPMAVVTTGPDVVRAGLRARPGAVPLRWCALPTTLAHVPALQNQAQKTCSIVQLFGNVRPQTEANPP
jgi:hypothetical protein